MGGLNIKRRIWLSIGIFVFGYFLSTVVNQLDRRGSERHLGTIHDVLLPAARNGREADAAFERLIKGYMDSFVGQDSSGLERARVEGFRALDCLNAIARLQGISGLRAASAFSLGSALRRFLDEANATYGSISSDGYNIPHDEQDKVRHLAVETKTLRSTLSALGQDLAHDLDSNLYDMRSHSARMRSFALSLFVLTLTVAVILVNFTIRHSIMTPIFKVQADLAHERDLLRILLDNIPDYIYFKDGESKFIRINKALAAQFGEDDPEAARGRSDADYFDSETAARLRADDEMILMSGQPNMGEFEKVTRQGVTRWMATTKVPVNDGLASGALIVGISRDITEWKETMEQLRRSEASFRLLFSTIPYAVLVCDAETLQILEANTAASVTYGYSLDEFRSMRIIDFLPLNARQQYEQVDTANLPSGMRKHLTKEGRFLDVEVAVHVLEFHGRSTLLCMAQDVTERKRLEIDLLHAQKLEAVGQLAAGIAHEINTPIQYVGDNLRFFADAFGHRQVAFAQFENLLHAALAGEISPQLLADVQAARDEADLEYLAAEVPRALEQSLDGVERVATIVRAMKAFAHPGSPDKMPADLNKALSDALVVARNEIKYVADVVTDFDELPPVLCHLGDLNQVFLNLLVNAAHAIGDALKTSGTRGEISVRTRSENNHVVISISDTGCGIPASIQSRVFDPFFTTKEVGKGTGQGLAIARNIIVEKHGGSITFEPNLPQGTTFLLSLPIDGLPGTKADSARPAPELAAQ